MRRSRRARGQRSCEIIGGRDGVEFEDADPQRVEAESANGCLQASEVDVALVDAEHERFVTVHPRLEFPQAEAQVVDDGDARPVDGVGGWGGLRTTHQDRRHGGATECSAIRIRMC